VLPSIKGQDLFSEPAKKLGIITEKRRRIFKVLTVLSKLFQIKKSNVDLDVSFEQTMNK
jgi:hypothetical protein